MYWTTELKCRKFTNVMCCYVFFIETTSLAAFAFAIYCICTGDFDTSAWNLPFNIVVPFDTTPIWGWFVDWFYQAISGFAYGSCMIIPTIYFVCTCNYIIAICTHFELLVNSLSGDVREIHMESKHQLRPKMWIDVRQKLSQLVDGHTNLLE